MTEFPDSSERQKGASSACRVAIRDPNLKLLQRHRLTLLCFQNKRADSGLLTKSWLRRH